MNSKMRVKPNLPLQKKFGLCLSLCEKHFALSLKNGPSSSILESMRNLQHLFFLRLFFKCISTSEVHDLTKSLILNAGINYNFIH